MNMHLSECCCLDCMPGDQIGHPTDDVAIGDTIWFRLNVDGLTRQCKAKVVHIIDFDYVKVQQPGYNSTRVIHAGDIVR